MAKCAFTAGFLPTLSTHEGAGPVELLGGINKDMCGPKLLPTTVLACGVNFIHFCDLVKNNTAVCVLVEGTTHLLTAYPLTLLSMILQ